MVGGEMSEAPKRIQRKRTRGWRLPEGAVAVTRPTFWGNPFPVGAWVKVVPRGYWRRIIWEPDDERKAALEGFTKKESIIRAIQIAEGYSSCFGTATVATCGQAACCWRDAVVGNSDAVHQPQTKLAHYPRQK